MKSINAANQGESTGNPADMDENSHVARTDNKDLRLTMDVSSKPQTFSIEPCHLTLPWLVTERNHGRSCSLAAYKKPGQL